MGELNVKPRTIFCRDNIDILKGINSNCIDLIYLDPPFNKNKVFTAPIGSSAEGAEFSDIFEEKDIKKEWVKTIEEDNHELYSYLSGVQNLSNSYNYCYLVYMAIRLIECSRLLKKTGSIYLHCDPTMSHHLKIVMDCIFGEDNFTNEIVWHYFMGGKPNNFFARKHDIVLLYSKSEDRFFNKDILKTERFLPYKPSLTTHKGLRELPCPSCDKGSGFWKSEVKMDDVWDISGVFNMSREYVGYPTQKPLALLERIIKASSSEGDIVLDPFCGCATTCIASEKLARKWIGVDISQKAYQLVKKRLEKEVPADLVRGEPLFDTSAPKRDFSDDKKKGYLYVIGNAAWPGQYKVGVAKQDVHKRLNSYQTSDPMRSYKIIHTVYTEHYRELESHIHKTLPNKHEWVTAEIGVIKKIIADYKLSTSLSG